MTTVMMMKLFVVLLSLLCSRVVHSELVCTLGEAFQLDEDGLVTMETVKNTVEGTFTMRLTYSGGQSWIGIGINHEGSADMSPATAVIGRMLDGEPSVLKYDLESDAKDASGVIPMDAGLQNLQDASFFQDDEKSVLEFTQFLDEETQTVTDESVWIFAVGLPGNAWLGKHRIHGAFYLTINKNCEEVAEEPTSPPNEDDTNSTGTDTTDETTEEGDGDTQDQDPSGATDSSQSGVIKLASATEETRPLWIAHGVLMALAWGVCAPIAIGAVLLRNVKRLASGGCWYKIHYYVNWCNILFTSVGFFLAVAATKKEGEPHFTENTHTKAGLAIFLIVFFQFGLAFLRPDPPKAPSQQEAKQVEPASNTSSESSGSPRRSGIDRGITVDPPTSSVKVNNGGEIEVEEDFSESDSYQSKSVKTKTRLAWEISHRFIGVALLGLAWYNCTSGIQLQVEKYDENDDKMGAFWGITGGISGLIFFFAYVVRL